MKLIDLFRKKEEETPVVNDTVNEDISTNEVVDEVEETAEIETQEEVKESPKEEIVEEKIVVEDYATLKEEYADAVKEYNTIWDDCAYRGLPYREMLIETENVRNRMIDLDERMRLIQEPRITYKKRGEKINGDKFTLPEFIDMCNTGMIKEGDGSGFYASSKGISDIEIYPSDIMHGRYRQDFTHVIWHDTIPFE